MPISFVGTGLALGLRSQGNLYTPGSANFMTPGMNTWLCPASVFSVTATCVGGGANGSYSGGGGAGGTSSKTISVTPGVTYNVYVGSAGQDSYFDSPSTLAAYAGSGTTGGGGNGTSTTNGGNAETANESGGYPYIYHNGGDGGSSTVGSGGVEARVEVNWNYDGSPDNNPIWISDTETSATNGGVGAGGGGGVLATDVWFNTTRNYSIPPGSGGSGKVSLVW